MDEGGIYGLDCQNLPENTTPLEAIALVKCLDDRGELTVFARFTQGMSTWEALGIVTMMKAQLEQDLVDGFLEDE